MRRMLFEKTGKAVWMSHLDTMRLMQRAFRRAGVLLHHSQGYTPHAYVSMPLPLSVGTESICEIMEYELDSELRISPEQMNAVLPEGVRVLSVYESDRKAKHLTYLEAELRLFYDSGIPANSKDTLDRLFSASRLTVEKRGKRGLEEMDIRPMIKRISVLEENGTARILCTVCAQNPALNPLLLLSAIERYAPEYKPDHCRCRRLEILDENFQVFR